MRDNLIFLLILVLFLVGCYSYYMNVIVPQPLKLQDLKLQIAEKNKQLLAAQILAEKRPGVTSLIQGNLIQGLQDSLAEKASVPFLRFLTNNMDRLDIRLISLTPKDILDSEDPAAMAEKDYIEIPYEMKVLASYDEFGKFLNLLEQSSRLIRISSFDVINEIDQGSYEEEVVGKPRQHPITVEVNTIAILKASSRGEQGKHN
jgi:hypothetical protein